MATVITNKADYQPGETAQITAEGFTAGSTIEFHVQHASGPGDDGLWGTSDDVLNEALNASGSGHEPWFVTDGGTGDLDGSPNGVIKTTWYVNPDDSYLESFLLTAVGDNLTSSDTTDDQKAFTTFTDGQLALWAWRNQPGPTLDSWDAGTTIQQSNSVYAEDEVIPFRWTSLSGPGGASDLKEGVLYTIQLDYAFAGGTAEPDKFFFDYLTSYNATESAAAPFGPGSDLTGFQTGNLSTVAIANDTHLAIEPHAAGDLTLFNIKTSSVVFGAYTVDPVNSQQEDRRLNITFTPDDGDGVAGETLNVGVAWGGHLAASSFYGFENGAADFPGASPQMVVDLTPTKSGETENVNINPNAIVAQGQITVIKDAVPLGSGAYSTQDFVYTIIGPNGFNQTFTLDDDGGADVTFNNQQAFFGLAEGVYTVTESPVSNWVVSNISANENGAEDTTSADIFTADVATRSISITVANGEVWATTFVNEEGEPPNYILGIQKDFVSVTGGNGNSVADWAGDVLNYTVRVSNPGTAPLTGVTVVDPLTGQNISGVMLAVGETKTYNTSYVLTQADLDGNGGGDGDIDNTATADSNETLSVSDSAEVPLTIAPLLALDKQVTGVDVAGDGILNKAGDIIDYNLIVTNTGNQPLTNVTVTDPLTGTNTVIASLGVGLSQAIAAQYVLTQADIDSNGTVQDAIAGFIDNTGTADSDQTGPVTDSEQVPVAVTPLLAIDKQVTGVDVAGDGILNKAGDIIDYNLVVTNTGNQTLTNVTVTDPLTGTNTVIASLGVGLSQAIAAQYVLTQADIDSNGTVQDAIAGFIDNTGTADSDQTGPVTDSEQVPVAVTPLLAIDKQVTGVDVAGDGILNKAGDIIDYNLVVTNTGNQTLTNVTVTDPLTGTNTVIASLGVGLSQAIAAQYVLTQADIDSNGTVQDAIAGFIDNTGTADSDQTGPVTDSEQVPVAVTPLLAIDKQVTGVDVAGDGILNKAGDIIDYNLVVTNTGNQTLTNVTVTDPLTGTNTVIASLGVGLSQAIAAQYVLTQADIDSNGTVQDAIAGFIDNTGTADSDQTGPVTDSEQVPVAVTPLLAIDKQVTGVDVAGDGILNKAGDIIDYNLVVTNTGNQTLTNVTVTDPLTGTNTVIASLGVGLSQAIAAQYVLTQADIDSNGTVQDAIAGFIDNTGTADSDQTGPVTDSEQVPLVYNPALDVEKYVSVDGKALNDPTKQWEDADLPTGPTLTSTAGINPEFKFVVVNTGNVTLTNVTLSDDVFNIDTSNGDKIINIASLGVGDGLAGGSDTYEYVYTGASWKAGQHVNTATADSTESAPDTDKAYYYGTMPAMVTNSSLCDFGDKFNLIFTPDFKNGSGNYKLADSNPGQFYYNMFDVEGAAGETKTYSFEIPKEFVAQGAVPIHIYDQWDIVEHDGQMCIEPSREIANYKLGDGGGVTITDLDGDGNNEYTFDATFSDTGMLYLNMHLDFAGEKQTGWIKSGENALDNPNLAGIQQNILENTNYMFSALIDGAQVTGSADSISNDNIFKNIKGLGGMFQADDSGTIGVLDEIPVSGQHLIMKDSKGTVVGDAVTDADGWYFAQFLATGKAAQYNVYWDKGNDNSTAGDVYKTLMMGGSAGKWAEADWTVVDIVGYNPPADLIIDGYSSIL